MQGACCWREEDMRLRNDGAPRLLRSHKIVEEVGSIGCCWYQTQFYSTPQGLKNRLLSKILPGLLKFRSKDESP